MATRKTVTAQTMIGEAGIALIGDRALRMGHLFHPRRVDHGIDGHLDLIEPGSGALLNQTVLVQSKASSRDFQGETAEGFHYLCDPRDLAHWLAGNAPVIIVFSHPDRGEAWWVDVKAVFPDARSRATRRIDVVKRACAFDETASGRLLRLGVPASAGLYLQPAPLPERLETNLLPIESVPQDLFVAPAATASYVEAGQLLRPIREDGRQSRDAWILRDGMVISFGDLRTAALRPLCAGPVEVHDTARLAGTDNLDERWTFADLLNRTIQGAYPQLRWHNSRRHVHFRPSRDLAPRSLPSGSGNRTRTVFKGHGLNAAGNGPGYFSHAAVKLRARLIGRQWYCQIDPDYCFTADGAEEHRNADALLAAFKRLDRHAAVAGWTRMWALFLQGPDDLFAPDLPVRLGKALTVDVDHGIDERFWGPAPGDELTLTEPEADDDESAEAEPDVAGHLDLNGYEQHLLSLLEEEEPDQSHLVIVRAGERPPAPQSRVGPTSKPLPAAAPAPRRRRRATREAGDAR
jgi:hypothetical protein